MPNARQATMIPREGPLTKCQLDRMVRMAEIVGVTVERYIDIVRKRRLLRQARFYRRRSRQRVREKAKAEGRKVKRRELKFGKEYVYEGEGELGPLLRSAGMKQEEFLALSGITLSAYQKWYGHPIYRWPVELVTNVVWARRMAEKLREMGFDPEAFKPQVPTEKLPHGRYPRTTAQGSKFQLEPESAEEGR